MSELPHIYITKCTYKVNFMKNYNKEGRWFDPSWCHWKFSLT